MSRIARNFHRARMLAAREFQSPESRRFWRWRTRELAAWLLNPET